MLVIPAIDLLGGHAVRLVQGDYARSTVYERDPADAARRFLCAGARRLHVVDLDGARAGRPVNEDAVARIVAAARISGAEVQLGGGLRDLASLERALDGIGVRFAILGTAAAEHRELLRSAAKRWPGRVIAGVDARDGRVLVRGWEEDAGIEATVLARELAADGAAAIVYTDVARDGTGGGPNVERTATVAAASGLPVIASGGVRTLEHLREVSRAGLAGSIIGRALYEGTLDLAAALQELAS